MIFGALPSTLVQVIVLPEPTNWTVAPAANSMVMVLPEPAKSRAEHRPVMVS